MLSTTSRCFLTVRVLATALLAVSVSTASPLVQVEWMVNLSNTNIVLIDNEVFLTTSDVPRGGGYVNTVSAWNRTQILWSQSSFGEVLGTTLPYAFPTIPKLAFLLVGNIQPPNVTAVVPSTGDVVWNSAGAFPSNPSLFAPSTPLQASIDGRTLYLVTEFIDSHAQLTAFDATTGETLFTKEEAEPIFQAARCGPSSVPYVVECSSTGQVVFWDGRTGVVLKNISLPIQAWWGIYYVPISNDLLLLRNGTALFALNTTKYTIAWSSVPWPGVEDVQASTQSFTTGKIKRVAVVAIGTSGIVGLDAATGATLWNQTATAICPFTSPAPGPANGFVFSCSQLGAFPSEIGDGDLFSFEVACSYTGSQLTIVGAMSAATGALKWWRYISRFTLHFPLLPIGPKAFTLLSPSADVVEFYDGNFTNFGSYPSVTKLGPVWMVTVVNATAFIQDSYHQYNRLAAVTVGES